MEGAHKVLAANRKVIFPLGYVHIQWQSPKRGGGIAALLRFGSAAPGLVPAHGVQSPIL